MRQNPYPLSPKYQADPVKTTERLIRPSGLRSVAMHALALALAGKAKQFMGVYRSDKTARMLIDTVLAVNLCLILLHIGLRLIAYFDFRQDQLFHSDLLITAEGGYPEMFNYFQLALLGWLMLDIFARTRQAIYAVLGTFFLFALGEDALHCTSGLAIMLRGSICRPLPPWAPSILVNCCIG